MKMALRISLGFALAAAMAASAQAHAALKKADPTVNGVASESPKQVKLIFSEEISIKLSGAAVTGSDGPIATAPAAVVAGDPKALAVALKAPLKPGVYKVRWHAVASDDGHRTQGTYSFTVK